jgi:hypothetical protein
MDDLQRTLEHRFPLLKSLCLYHGSGEREGLASFMGILLATMEGSRDSSFCFVLPRKAGIAPLSAVLYAIGRFACEFPMLAARYATTSFEKGQRVKLIPGDKVFVFAGHFVGTPFFRLELLDDKRRSAFSVPISEILRIEPTTYKIPKGKQEDISITRDEAPLSNLDRLIGTSTYGNHSLAANYVLYLGGRTDVDSFLATTYLGNAAGNLLSRLDDLVAPGTIGESGEIRHHDQHKSAGEPLVAITSRLDHVAEASRFAPPHSKVVVVDGAKRLTDLAAFDSIAATQNLIIVAEPDEEDQLRLLFDRGCRFWRFSLTDLEVGDQQSRDGKFFSKLYQSARNEAIFTTDLRECRDDNLEALVSALVKCQRALDESKEDATQLLLRDIYRLLRHCAELLEPPEADERALLISKAERISQEAADRRIWLDGTSADALMEACRAITRALHNPSLGLTKGYALRSLLAEWNPDARESLALVASSIADKTRVSRWLAKEHLHFEVLLPTKTPDTTFYDRLICTSWPGSRSFRPLARKYLSPRLTLIGYPFESQWLYSFSAKERAAQRIPDITPQEKSALVGVNAALPWSQAPDRLSAEKPTPHSSAHPLLDLEDRMTRKGILAAVAGEETVPAKLVSFVGDAYAFLTESYRVPVITDLISGCVSSNAGVPRRVVSDLRVGDALVFRERGRRDVILALADHQLGPDAPAIREMASRWHRALRESGLDETTLVQELKDVNCPRTLQTVRGWLADDSMIGPQSRTDLEAIAYALGSQALLNEIPDIWAAIHRLRGEHLSAGMKLSRILLEKLPERLIEISEGRTRIEIDNSTSAWIVQVDDISPTEELRPRSYVNVLLWDQ